MTKRIPDVGDDGLYRQDCTHCGKLMFRFGRGLAGGPLEMQCRSCKIVSTFRFSAPGRPELPDA